MSQHTVTLVLADFAKQTGLPELAFDKKGFCSIGIDAFIVTLELIEDGETLSFYVWLGTILRVERRDLIAMLIADANYLFKGTQGATVGMNRHTGDVVLAVRVPTASLSVQRFGKILENIVNLAENLKRVPEEEERRIREAAVFTNTTGTLPSNISTLPESLQYFMGIRV